MKGTAIKKLKSTDGASLMLALLFFVVCAVVGSIFLTAATVSAGRVTDVSKDNQYAQALNDATKLILDDIKDTSNQEGLVVTTSKSGETVLTEYKNPSGTVTYGPSTTDPSATSVLKNINRTFAILAAKIYESKKDNYWSQINTGFNTSSSLITLENGNRDHSSETPAREATLVIKSPQAEGSESVEVTAVIHMYSNYDVVMDISAGNDTKYSRSTKHIKVAALNTTATYQETLTHTLESGRAVIDWNWGEANIYE